MVMVGFKKDTGKAYALKRQVSAASTRLRPRPALQRICRAAPPRRALPRAALHARGRGCARACTQNISMVIDKSMVEAALIERKAVCELRSRFVLDAEYAFHDGVHLVLALRCMPGGDVHFHLEKAPFDGPKLRFYLASVILGLEALRGRGL